MQKIGISDIFAVFQVQLNADIEERENIKNICKETDQLSREITTVLQAIHSSEEAISPACLKARNMFGKARDGYLKLKEAVALADYYKYYDHWRMMTQRYCFLITLTIWLESGTMATYDTVAEILGLNANGELSYFHLDIEDYLVSLLMLCTELGRLSLNSVTRQEYSRPMQICKFVADINTGFRSLNLKNDHLRKRYDALKYDIKKIEEIVYDLSVRGLLPGQENEDAEAGGNDDVNPELVEDDNVEPQLGGSGDAH